MMLKIVLNSSNPHTPGSVVAGQLTVQASEPQRYRQITVSLIGRGSVRWQEYVTSAAKCTYVDTQLVVWRSDNSPDGIFPAGRYTYPFQFTLPINCPSSFYSDLGKIRYKIKAVVSADAREIKEKATLIVVAVVNAATSIPQPPVKVEERLRVDDWCCHTGEITFTAQMQRTGFNTGEEIPISFYIENGSGKRISVESKLVEAIDFFAMDSCNQIVSTIVESRRTYVDSHTSSGEQYMLLPILSALRPAMTQAGIIQSRHSVNVELTVPGLEGQEYTFPVVIGNTNTVPENVNVVRM